MRATKTNTTTKATMKATTNEQAAQRPAARDRRRSVKAPDSRAARRAGRPHYRRFFRAGVDSTALLVALWLAGIVPDLITFADTGGEKKSTMEHLARMNSVLTSWGWPLIQICKHRPLPSTTYRDLFGNCMANETLPSLAFGMKSWSNGSKFRKITWSKV